MLREENVMFLWKVVLTVERNGSLLVLRYSLLSSKGRMTSRYSMLDSEKLCALLKEKEDAHAKSVERFNKMASIEKLEELERLSEKWLSVCQTVP